MGSWALVNNKIPIIAICKTETLAAPQMVGDADDTAKAILTLTLLGRTADPTSMIERFESASYFRTFDGERDSSFSANCNVLSSLLHMPEPMKYHSQILKATIFLCDTWDREAVRDKWVSLKICIWVLGTS